MKEKHTFLKACCAAFLMTAPILGSAQYASAQTRSGAEVSTDVPRTISYQGLVNRGDKPVTDGKHSFTFTLYGDEQRQTVVWSGTYSLDTKDGIVNALLGSGTSPLPSATDMSKPLWLGVRVDNELAEAPLSQLTASAYALNVSDNSITTSKLADKSVTADKIGTDYIASVSVNGRPIKGVGKELNIKSGPGLEVKYDHSTSTIELSNTAATGEPKGPKVQWTGYNPGTNDDGSSHATMDLTNTIGGGDHNRAYDPAVVSSSWHASVLGGEYNYAYGNHSAIAGGGYLKLGDYSFGYNNSASAAGNQVDLTSSGANWSPTAYFGNLDLVLGNYVPTTGGSPGALKIYGSNNSTTYAGTAKYSALTVGAQANNVLLKLPTNAPSSGQYLHVNAVTGTNPYTVDLDWSGSTVTSLPWSAITSATNVGQTLNVGAASTLQPSGYPGVHGTILANGLLTSTGATLGANLVPFGLSSGTGEFDQDANFSYATGSGLSLNTKDLTIQDAKLKLLNSTTGFRSSFTQSSSASTMNLDYVLPTTAPSTTGGEFLKVVSRSGSTVTLDWAAGGTATNKWTKGGDVMTTGSPLLGTAATSTLDLQIESKGTTLLQFDGANANILGGQNASITGGAGNIISGGGLTSNTIIGISDVIAGGDGNLVGTLPSTIAKFAVIGGGTQNTTHANSSTIGGGNANTINSAGLNPGGFANNGLFSTIPGGDNLTANSYAQTVVGKYNLDNQATVAVGGANTNAPLFVVGNGTAVGARSNAFEVSYNGHATPMQVLGNAAVAGPVKGGRYNDNSIDAWGEVTAAGGVTNDFGVVGVVFAAPNVYTVTLNYTPAGGAVSAIGPGSITATVEESSCAPGPGFCTVSQIGACAAPANTFQVRTYGPGGALIALPFFFHVSAR